MLNDYGVVKTRHDEPIIMSCTLLAKNVVKFEHKFRPTLQNASAKGYLIQQESYRIQDTLIKREAAGR